MHAVLPTKVFKQIDLIPVHASYAATLNEAMHNRLAPVCQMVQRQVQHTVLCIMTCSIETAFTEGDTRRNPPARWAAPIVALAAPVVALVAAATGFWALASEGVSCAKTADRQQSSHSVRARSQQKPHRPQHGNDAQNKQ